MSRSMKDYLTIITPHLDNALVSAEALSHIQSLAQILPPSSLAGFECHLGANQSEVDFQVGLPCLKQNLPERFLTTPAWQFLQDFYHQWVSPNSLLHQEIENIELKFDVNGQIRQIPIPEIFLQFNRKLALDAESLIEITTELLKVELSSLFKLNLRLCANSLPTGATISHLGARLSHQTNAVRVNVKGSPEPLSDYLTRMGWSDPTNTLSFLVSTLSEFTDFILLSFDVGDTILPKIGLECCLNNQPYDEPRWQLLLECLVAVGLCTPAKKDALLAWSGLSQKSSISDLWLNNISFGDRFSDSKAYSDFCRSLNHIKLIYQPGISLEAKGYLTLAHNCFAPDVMSKKDRKTETSDCL